MLQIERKHLPCGKLRNETFAIWSQDGDWLSLEGKIDWSKCLVKIKASSHRTALKKAQLLFPEKAITVAMYVGPDSDLIVPETFDFTPGSSDMTDRYLSSIDGSQCDKPAG